MRPLRLYIFQSDVNKELRAFADDLMGSRLPKRFCPWHVVGRSRQANHPHELSRDAIEKAIAAQGFQLWRVKPNAKVDRHLGQDRYLRDGKSFAYRLLPP